MTFIAASPAMLKAGTTANTGGARSPSACGAMGSLVAAAYCLMRSRVTSNSTGSDHRPMASVLKVGAVVLKLAPPFGPLPYLHDPDRRHRELDPIRRHAGDRDAGGHPRAGPRQDRVDARALHRRRGHARRCVDGAGRQLRPPVRILEPS